MSVEKPKSLDIDPNVYVRLNELAEQKGETFEQLAARILQDAVDDLERDAIEHAEDERRWQNYLESGTTIPFDAVRGKLQRLAARAARPAPGYGEGS